MNIEIFIIVVVSLFVVSMLLKAFIEVHRVRTNYPSEDYKYLREVKRRLKKPMDKNTLERTYFSLNVLLKNVITHQGIQYIENKHLPKLEIEIRKIMSSTLEKHPELVL